MCKKCVKNRVLTSAWLTVEISSTNNYKDKHDINLQSKVSTNYKVEAI